MFDGRGDGDYNGTGLMEISKIVARQDTFSLKHNHLTEFSINIYDHIDDLIRIHLASRLREIPILNGLKLMRFPSIPFNWH